MNYLKIGYAIIQLPEYLLSLFNYLKKKGNAKTVKSTVIVKPNDAPILHEKVNTLELTVKNIESKLEEIINLISLK